MIVNRRNKPRRRPAGHLAGGDIALACRWPGVRSSRSPTDDLERGLHDGDAVLSAEQRLVLQAVYDHFHGSGSWPTFIAIDRPYRRTHGLDTQAVLLSLPDSLIIKPRSGMWFRPDDELRLRLPGVHVCEGGAEDTDRFVRLLRWLAQREMTFEPESGSTETMPRVTAAEVCEHLGLATTDHVLLERIFAMLQLDRWGLGSGGSDPDGWWFVQISPDIWRFRDVQTVEDCVAARTQWVAEAEAAVQPMRNAAQPPEYYHVRLSTRSSRSHDEVRLDLSVAELESRFLAPYREGRAMVINGKTIPVDDLAAIRINRTSQSSEQLRSVVKAERRASNVIVPISDNWYIAKQGVEVTDKFITEPPGSAIPKQPAVSTSQPAASSKPATYADGQIVEAIRGKEGKSAFNVSKLLRLIDELNDNYAKQNIYATHTSLRALLDHVPPIFGFGDFKAVANNYSWSKTDKAYMKKLLEFKIQADDALHRQISPRADLLSFEHLPTNLYLNHLLQECADKL